MDYSFYEKMKVCKGHREDGKDGYCIDTHIHNLGCVGCPIENGLYEPDAVEDNENNT